MTGLVWALAFATVVCVGLAVWVWVLLRKVERHDALTVGLTASIPPPPDFTVSIADWGEDFEGSAMRWRWVIWQGDREGVPMDLGNAPQPIEAWAAVMESIESSKPPGPFTPKILVEWKVISHGDD